MAHTKKMVFRKILSALGLSFTLLFLPLGLMGSLFAILPLSSASPIAMRLLFVWTLSFLTALCGFFNLIKPHWWLATGGTFGISLFLLAGAIHGFTSVFSNLIWLPPLLFAFVLAWVLPYIDLNLARIINNEQLGPRSKVGKGCIFIFLSLMGSSGALGALFGMYSYRFTSSTNLGMLVIGISFAILAVALSQTFSYQMWEKRQVERKAKNEPILK